VEYNVDDNNILNRLYSGSPNAPCKATLTFSNLEYIIDFTRMIQTNQQTKVQRSIRVKSTSPSPPIHASTSPANLSAICAQVEHYFSDSNLKTDAFLHSKLTLAADGWIPLDTILAFSKMRAMKATSQDTQRALQSSAVVETKARPARRPAREHARASARALALL
jgi:hypothetical protein